MRTLSIDTQQIPQARQFVTIVLLLLALGLATLYSSSYDKALRLDLPVSYFFSRQLMFALLGVGCSAVLFLMPMRLIRRLIPLLVILSIVLMLLTSLTPLGEVRLGARRWIRLGPLSFQPSELVKVAVILYLANYMSTREHERHLFRTVTIPILMIFFASALILLQRDYSTTMIFLFLSFSMLLVSGIKVTYLLYYLLLAGVPGILLLLTEQYRLKRVIGFIFPDIDPSGMNYQVNISLDAIASGGLFGKGFGQGEYKLGKLPEVQSDFIFASFAEEMGLFGVLCVILLFILLALLGYRAASKHKHQEQFLYLAGFGMTHLLMWQVILNLAVVTNLVPPTGIPMPFFSSGGTNLLINLGMCALLLKILLTPVEDPKIPVGSPEKRIFDYE